MSEYKPSYDINKVSDSMTRTGKTSRELAEIEESSQRVVAENPQWILAKKVGMSGDSKLELEALGFKVLGEADDLFYNVEPPKGWDKSTEGYWTTVTDSEGKERINQFYKGAFYDRDAFLNISRDED